MARFIFITGGVVSYIGKGLGVSGAEAYFAERAATRVLLAASWTRT